MKNLLSNVVKEIEDHLTTGLPPPAVPQNEVLIWQIGSWSGSYYILAPGEF